MAKTILIVDNSVTILMLLEQVLSQAGLETITAGSGEEAVSVLERGVKPDMVITDLNLGGINGIQLVRDIRKIPGHQFMPIVLLSTESQQTKRNEAKSAGATGWMVKPFQPQALLQVVKQLVPGAFDAEEALDCQDYAAF